MLVSCTATATAAAARDEDGGYGLEVAADLAAHISFVESLATSGT